MTIYAYSDGGVRGRNTRNVETWGSFKVGSNPIEEREFGIGSNQTAEVNTLIACLTYIWSKGIDNVVVYIDSQWTFNTVSGIWKVKDARLNPLVKRASELMRLTGVELEWRPREEIVAVLGH